MILSAQQEQARSAILSWYRSPNRKPWFLLEGSAGSGKTSVITATTNSIKGKVFYVAPTAKAALVMRRKGCEDPRTIHSLIYTPKGLSGDRAMVELLREIQDTPSEDLKSRVRPMLQSELEKLNHQYTDLAEDKKPKRILELRKALATNISNVKELLSAVNPLFQINPDSAIRDASLVVLDEVSMVGDQVMKDILSFGVPVLAQGDFAQLPPVKASAYFDHTSADFRLTEVHRQAKDSPILYLAHLAKDGKPLPVGVHGNCIVTREGLVDEALAADQIIVGTHKTRWATNDKVRQLKGFTQPRPEVGDRVICRHNNMKLGLVNGDQFEVTSFSDGEVFYNVGISNDSIDTRVFAHKEYFQRKEPNPWTKSAAECLDYSYAITGHLSQGSEWPTVYLKDESKFFRSDRHKHLYTCITRASEKIVIKI